MLDDFSKLASGAVGTVFDMKKEFEHLVKHNIEQMLESCEVVTREEHEIVKAMAIKARAEQEKMQQRITDLEAKLSGSTVTKKAKTTKTKAKIKDAK